MTNTQKYSPESNKLNALQLELKRVTEKLIQTQEKFKAESGRREDLELVVDKYLNEANTSSTENDSENKLDGETKKLREILSNTKAELKDMYTQKKSIETMLQKYLDGFGSFEAVSRLTSLIELNPEAIVALDTEGLVLEWNPSAEKMFGWNKAEVVGKLLPIVSEEHMDDFKSVHARVIKGEQLRMHEAIRYTKSGTPLNVSISSMSLKNEKDKTIGTTTIITDLTTFKKRTDLANRLATVVEQSPNMIMITDKNQTIEYANQSMIDITGYTVKELIGQKASMFKTDKTPDKTFKEMGQVLSEDGAWQGELVNAKKSGEYFLVSALISPLRNDKGIITHYASIQEDQTEILKLKKELQYISYYDTLTGLHNEHSFKNNVTKLIKKAKREETEHAVAIIDLDDFELINTNCGLKAGDVLVKKTGKTIKLKVHDDDIVARMSRDKFGVLMQYCTPQQAHQKIDSIREAIHAAGFKSNEQSYNITASIGLVPINRDSDIVETVIENAEIACNKAKEQGKNRSVTFSESQTDLKKRHEEMDMAAKIMHAFDNNALFILWQPIIPINNDDKLKCVEVHVNMSNATGNAIGANIFYPVAEKYGLSPKIDLWVIKEVLSALKKNTKLLSQVKTVVINLSGKSVCDEDSHGRILEVLDATKIPLSKLCFEIDEKTALNRQPEIRHFMYALKNHGCNISIECFGKNISSFTYLQTIPFDYIKIDRTYLENIVAKKAARVFVKSIHDICSALGKKTIAEYIPDDNTLEELRKIGVNYAQGYTVGSPESLENINL